MKYFFSKTHFDQKRIIGSETLPLALLLIGLLLVLSQLPAIAQEPDEAPDFSVAVYTSDDGASTIVMQEAVLDADYFTRVGIIDDLQITPDGLTLAEGVTSGVYLSGAVHSPLDFTTDIVPLWQADLPDGTGLMLETRLSLDGHSWSEWLEMPEAFYPVRNDEHSGHLIWVGSEQALLQVRVTLQRIAGGVSPTLHGLTLVFNDTSAGPTDGDIARKMSGAPQMTQETAEVSVPPPVCPAKPSVVSRTDWGCPDGQDSPRRPPVYEPVTHIIIHHTVTPNHVQPYHDWAGWVRSVWNYHTNVLWWRDVGYNYLIDPNGVIYEGRAGGDDVVGIHDTHNYGSMAIGFLGCYGNCGYSYLSEADPTEAMLASAAQLMAWKLGQQGIDPFSYAPYSYLADVPVIAGGRDVTATSSPGDRLYDQLPNLRQRTKDEIDQCQIVPDTIVFVDPEETQLCAEDTTTIVTTQVKIAQVANMQGFEFSMYFAGDEGFAHVVDADPTTPGIQIRAGSAFSGSDFFIATNEADELGYIRFAGAFQGNKAYSGDATLAEIDLLPDGHIGRIPLSFHEVKLSDPDGQAIQHDVLGGFLKFSECTGSTISGRVLLQGRDDYGETEIFLAEEPCPILPGGVPDAVTDSSGDFEITVPSGHTYQCLLAFQPGYLTGQREDPEDYLGVITLPGGDVKQNDLIDIFDLAYIGSHFITNDSTADVNADGGVDIFDLAIAAGNYLISGPVIDWQ